MEGKINSIKDKLNMRRFGKRPLVFALIFMIFGILIGTLCLKSMAGRISCIVILTVLVVLLFILKRTRKFAYLSLMFLVGWLWIVGSCDIYNSKTIESGSFTLSGKVKSEISVGDRVEFMLDDIVVDGVKYDGTAYVYYYGEDIDFSSGDYVSVNGKLTSFDYDPFEGKYASMITNGNRYSILTSDCVLQKKSEPEFLDKIRLKVKENFYTYTRQDTADIATALMFGDKNFISDSLYDDVKVSGLAHTLAVSGLHIGIFAAFLNMILKKCKAKSLIRLIVVGIVLMIYLAFCNFPASAVRAYVMILCIMFAGVIGAKRDNLSSLALAGIIILGYSPLSLFASGFQLSMCAVLGIAILNKPILKVFKRKNKFTEIVTTSVSTNLMTYPISAAAFGTFPTLFILSNIIILPIMSVMFIGILFLTLFTLIVPLPNILVIADYLLLPFKTVVFLCGSVGIANMNVGGLGVLCIGYYGTLFVLSNHFFATKAAKIKICLSLWAASLLLFALLRFLAA